MPISDGNEYAIIVNNIVVTIAAAHNLIIFVYHGIIVRKYLRGGKIPWLSMFPLTTHSIMALYNIFHDWDAHLVSCAWAMKLGHFGYEFAKISLYIFYTERLFAVFDSSPLKFKKSTIIISRIAWSIWTLCMLPLAFLFTAAHAHYDPDTKTCVSHMSILPHTIAALMDLFICVTISVLFARRMLTLVFVIGDNEHTTEMSRSVTNSDSAKNDNKQIHESVQNLSILKILRKSTLLAFIGLLTTQLSLVFASVVGMDGMFVCIDWMINCWCVVLMFSKYKRVYVTFCHCNRMELCFGINCLVCYSCHCCCKIVSPNAGAAQTESSISPKLSDVESVEP